MFNLICLFILMAVPAFSAPATYLNKAFQGAAEDFAKGHYADAARFYRIMMSTYHGTDWEAKSGLYLAQCYEKSGRQDDALEIFHQIADAFPASPEGAEAAFRLAAWDENQGDFKAAAECYQAVVTRGGAGFSSAEALLNLANLRARQKDYAKAAEAYTRLAGMGTATDWPRREGLMGRAKIFRLTGAWDQAAKVYAEVAASQPGTPAAAQAGLATGHCWAQAHQWSKSATQYLSFANSFPEQEDQGWFYAAKALASDGQDKQARDLAQKTVDLHAASPWGRAAQRLLDDLRSGGGD